MKCIYCNQDTRVIDSRYNESVIRRRRECLKCKQRFTTYERASLDLNIIKKDGRRELFNREKLKVGFIKACEKRPVSLEKINDAVDYIEKSLRKLGKKEVKSKFIGDKVMQKLKSLDNIAYIRFASVYKEFKDLDDFKEEVKKLR
nr:transcriptional repressor NrdR [Candidatus Woesearchaeota archaeon]